MADQPGAPPASAASDAVRLKGHIGHLTDEEHEAFESFKKLATDAGLYKEVGVNGKPTHDDGTLVRYLRARKFVPQEAFAQFKDTESWRKQNNLDTLYEQIEIQDYREARSVYPQWTGRRDKRGIPVYLYEVGKLDSKKMIAYSTATSKSKKKGPSPSRMLRLFALYENLTRFVMPLCSSIPGRPNDETPVDQSNNIVDISNVGLKQFWNLKSHMQDASQLATAHYPETLDRIFIIGAPSFFPTVWGWIKRWFDPITTSKIFILSHSQVKTTLERFIDIDSIPKKYGGGLDFECGMLPNLDPKIRKVLDLKGSEEDFLTAPVRWMDDDRGELIAVGVGSMDGHPRKETAALLHTQARLILTRSATQQKVPQINLGQTPPAPAFKQSQPSTQNNSVTNLSRQTTQPDSLAPSPADTRPVSNTIPSSPLVNSELASKSSQRVEAAPPSSAPQDFAPGPAQNGTIVPQAQPDEVGTTQNMPPPSAAGTQKVSAPMVNGAVLPNRTAKSGVDEGIVDHGNSIPQLPPSSIDMPAKTEPPPMTRTETEYMTPLGDPSDASKQLS